MMMTHIVAILWTKMALKQHNMMLAKVSPNLTFERCLELDNCTFNNVHWHLFPLSLSLRPMRSQVDPYMMRPSGRWSPIISIFPRFSLAVSPSLMDPALVHYSVGVKIPASTPRSHLPGRNQLPSHPIFLVRGVRGRNFNMLLPPSLLWVGGVLGWYWKEWQSLGVEDWMVEVLHSC